MSIFKTIQGNRSTGVHRPGRRGRWPTRSTPTRRRATSSPPPLRLDRSDGPFDVTEVEGRDGRVDLGALWIRGLPGMELRLEVDAGDPAGQRRDGRASGTPRCSSRPSPPPARGPLGRDPRRDRRPPSRARAARPRSTRVSWAPSCAPGCRPPAPTAAPSSRRPPSWVSTGRAGSCVVCCPGGPPSTRAPQRPWSRSSSRGRRPRHRADGPARAAAAGPPARGRGGCCRRGRRGRRRGRGRAHLPRPRSSGVPRSPRCADGPARTSPRPGQVAGRAPGGVAA